MPGSVRLEYNCDQQIGDRDPASHQKLALQKSKVLAVGCGGRIVPKFLDAIDLDILDGRDCIDDLVDLNEAIPDLLCEL